MIDKKNKNPKVIRPKSPPKTMAIEPSLPKRVQLTCDPKNECLKISSDSLAVTGCKGYRSVLANFPIIEGTYYFEVKIEKSSTSQPFPGVAPQVRIGIATKKLDKEISLGSDEYSYGYKSLDGCKIHQGIKQEYGEKYGEGDVIGCLVHMGPPKPKMANKIEFNEGSYLAFFKNGKSVGGAFQNLKEGFYYAAVSLYMNAKVRVNFGPEFEKPVDFSDPSVDVKGVKSYSERADEPQLYTDIDLLQ